MKKGAYFLLLGVIYIGLLALTHFRVRSVDSKPILRPFEGAEYWQLAHFPTREGFWEYLILKRTGDPKLVALAKCESQLYPFARGDHNGKKYKAYGLLQFHEPTFLAFAARYGVQDPDWYSATQQIDLAKKMVDDGYGKLWTCWRKI
jgi:hypothetical protein